jgi:diguanylate cyclase (GGDEF)-like protein/PAS domain S-box-containing protein
MSRNVTPIDRSRAGVLGDVDLFRELAEQSGDVLAMGSDTGSIGYVSPAVGPMLGYAPSELSGRHVLRYVYPADAVRVRAAWGRAQQAGVRELTLEVRVRHKRGIWHWLEARVRWLAGSSDRPGRWVASMRDVTERRALEQRLAAQKERAQATLRAIADGVITVDARGCIEYINPAAERITNWSGELGIGLPVTRVFTPIGVRQQPPEEASVAGLSAWFHSVSDAPVTIGRHDGGEAIVQLAVASVADSDGQPQGLVLTFRDTSQTASLLRELAYRASHDSLTGLFNREEFERQLKRLASEAQAGSGAHVLAYVDLDQFKLVNDTCGHAAGDALLKDVARAMASLLAPGDVLARLGGDEFGLLMTHCSVVDAVGTARALIAAIGRLRFTWADRQFVLGASIGIAPVVRGGASADAIMMAADAACYVAKEQGRNRVHVFEPSDADVARHQDEMRWVPRLQTALELGDFQLLAHDIVPGASGVPTGRHLEVLIALPDASGRLIAPGEFLPAAQRYGLMGQIDRWVVRQVVEWLVWRGNTGRKMPELVAVNLSGSSLSDGEFRDFVEEQVRGLRRARVLCFEVTESEVITNLTEVSAFMQRIKAMGCSFALDDFGSGLSSFAYLRRLPVDYIKIDGQFVRDSFHDGVNLAMVDSIHRIGRVMGLKTIAESVENEATYRRMREIGVDYCQGFYFGVPKPLLSID